MLVAIDNISSGAIKGALVLQFIQVNQCNGEFKKRQKREINMRYIANFLICLSKCEPVIKQ